MSRVLSRVLGVEETGGGGFGEGTPDGKRAKTGNKRMIGKCSAPNVTTIKAELLSLMQAESITTGLLSLQCRAPNHCDLPLQSASTVTIIPSIR